MSETFLTIGIKADAIPEVAEYLLVTLDTIEPSDTQRLRPGLTSVTITINANDNPGGTLQFSSKMNSNYTIVVSISCLSFKQLSKLILCLSSGKMFFVCFRKVVMQLM